MEPRLSGHTALSPRLGKTLKLARSPRHVSPRGNSVHPEWPKVSSRCEARTTCSLRFQSVSCRSGQARKVVERRSDVLAYTRERERVGREPVEITAVGGLLLLEHSS
ncbi:hypothetical protein NL676_035494, partial [Syzygium grande]